MIYLELAVYLKKLYVNLEIILACNFYDLNLIFDASGKYFIFLESFLFKEFCIILVIYVYLIWGKWDGLACFVSAQSFLKDLTMEVLFGIHNYLFIIYNFGCIISVRDWWIEIFL